MGNTLNNAKAIPDSGLTLINALCVARAYNHDVELVRIVETHISWVLLTGRYAYKIKKPVNFGFLDFSSLEKRHLCCVEEVRLNRRFAGDLYLEVVPITGEIDTARIGGATPIIEYAVKMTQFPEGQLLSERAERGELSCDEIDQLARVVADFHDTVDTATNESCYGNYQDIKHWFDENFNHIRASLKEDHYQQQLQLIEVWGNEEWHYQSKLMQLRKQQGYVRECHGDLHLANITLIKGQVTPFDCIEFNPMLRWIDVISEVAFLVMDLLRFGYEHYALRLLNHYLQYTGDYQGLRLLHYYLTYRALVRAKVSLLRTQQCEGVEYQLALADFTVFINLAERFTKKASPMLIITHGYSGSGKSYFSEQVAERINALQIRSDIERKRLFGYKSQDSIDNNIDSGIYTQAANLKTYQYLAELAGSVIDAGFSVIIDATFLKSWQRELFNQLAAEKAVPFVILDFLASDDVLAQRILQRRNDVSDATIEVLRQQQHSAQPLSKQELACVITIDTENSHALDKLLTDVGLPTHEKNQPIISV